MTTYNLTYGLTPNGYSLASPYDWNNPGLWLQGSAPDSPSAQVFFTNVIDEGYAIAVEPGSSISIGSFSLAASRLVIEGQLTSAGSLMLNPDGNLGHDTGGITLKGGSLTAQSLHIGPSTYSAVGLFGYGEVGVNGPLYNAGTISGGDGTLDIKAAYFDNTGILQASNGTLIIATTSASGFANDVSGTLVGGTYETGTGATLDLKTPGLIHSDSAHLIFSGDASAVITSYDPSSGHYVSLQSSLTLITALGVVELDGGTYATPGSLTVAGNLQVIQNSSFTAGDTLYVTASGMVDLSVAPGGVPGLPGHLTVTARQIVDNGEIYADAYGGGVAKIDAAVTGGGGEILLGPEVSQYNINRQLQTTTAMVEITRSVTSTYLAYSDGSGTFILDAPGQFHGTFKNFQAGDSIVLTGIDFSKVTGFGYAGNTLSVHENGTVIHFAFAGDYTTGDFSLQAAPNGAGTAIIGVA